MPKLSGAPMRAAGQDVGLAPAAIFALFVVVGRWDLSRVYDGWTIGALAEPRVWIVLLMLLLVFSTAFRGDGAWDQSCPRARGITWRLCVFLAYAAMSAFWAPSHDAVHKKLLDVALLLAAAISAARLLDTWPSMLRSFWHVVAVGLLLIAILAAFSGVGDLGRMSVLGGGPNVFGRNMVLLAIAVAPGYVSLRPRFVANGVMLLAAFLVVLSGSRGALLAGVAGLAAFVWSSGLRWWRIALFAVLALAGSVLVIEFTEFGNRVVEVFRYRILDLAIEQRYDSGRGEIYAEAISLANSHPLLGLGLAGFPIVTGYVYPHNIFLEIYVECGVVGVVLFLSWLVPVILAGVRRSVDSHTFSAFVAWLVCAQFSGDLFDARGVFVLGTMVVISMVHVSSRSAVS